jgi:hypothetical protein
MRAWMAFVSLVAACGGTGGRAAAPPAPSATKIGDGNEAVELVLGRPVRSAHGLTWLWSKELETAVQERKGAELVVPVEGSRREIVVTKGDDRVSVQFDSSYSEYVEGVVFGNVFTARHENGTIRIRLYPEAAPLSWEEAKALVEKATGREPMRGLSPKNGTMRLTFASAIDGGDAGTVTVGLFTRTIISEEP